MWRRAAARCELPVVVGIFATVHPSWMEEKKTQAPSFHTRVIGNYENRIRKHSSPERVFEYFASVTVGAETYMTQYDFARAITPYAHREDTESRLGSKNYKYNFKAISNRPSKSQLAQYRELLSHLADSSEVDPKDVEKLLQEQANLNIDYQTHINLLREFHMTHRDLEKLIRAPDGDQKGAGHVDFFDLVDSDGDGLISYAEYMFFNTILTSKCCAVDISSRDLPDTVPERQFDIAFKMFDENGDGTIDQREFKQIMNILRLRTPAGRQDRSLDKEETPVFVALFGDNGETALSYEKFRAFRNQLREAVFEIQFHEYDLDGSNEMSAREFGMFLVTHAKQSETEKWVSKVTQLDEMKGSVSKQEFMNFCKFLDYLDELEVAMSLVAGEDGLNKELFMRATRAATKGKFNLVSPFQLDIIFELFDDDGNGLLAVEEFIDVMEKRQSSGLRQRRDLGMLDLFSRVYYCMKKTLRI